MKTYCLVSIIFAAFLFSCTNNNQDALQVNTQDTLVFAPIVTRIADLPDSLKPKTIDVSKMPEPEKIIIPEPGGSPRLHTTPDGQVFEIKPPERKLLPAFEGREEYISELKEKSLFDSGRGGLPHYTAFTTDDGLAWNLVTCATVDKSGNVWFGTWRHGISRFDGQQFINFSESNGLKGELVSTIQEDTKGNIWIGTAGAGISCYDGLKFKQYTTGQGLSNNNVRKITEDSLGKIWILTDKGIDVYNPGNNQITNIDKNLPDLKKYTINCLLTDKNGNVWFGTNRGAICFNPVKNQISDTLTELNGLASNHINCIHEDKEGKIWFGTDKGISSYNQVNNKKIINYTSNRDNIVTNILEDSNGKLWLETEEPTVLCFINQGTTGKFDEFFFFSYYGSLLAIDSFDKLWIGSLNSGVICFNPSVSEGSGSFTIYSQEQGLPWNGVSTIFEDSKGHLWFGSTDKVCFDGTHFTFYSPEQGVPVIITHNFIEDHSGKLWFNTWVKNKVYCFESLPDDKGMSFTIYTDAQGFTGYLSKSAAVHSGNIWFTSSGIGILCFDGRLLTLYSDIHGLGNNYINSVVEDKFGNIWFGTAGGGLSCFNPSNGGIFITFKKEQGLLNSHVNYVASDSQGNLWIATNKGLNLLGEAKLKMINDSIFSFPEQPKKIRNLFKTFTTSNGLPVNKITHIAELRKGKIALGSTSCLAIFSYPFDSLEPSDSLQDVEVFNFHAGYPVRGVLPYQSMFVDSKGILWIANSSEKAPLIRFDYDALRRNDKKPILTIRQVKINEEAVAYQTLANDGTQNNEGTMDSVPTYITNEVLTYGKPLNESERNNLRKKYRRLKFDGIRKFYPIPENLIIPYNHNRVTIGFGTSELIRPQLVEYQYMLDGYDNEWSPVVKNTTASFGNIKEGTYTFKVKARYTGPSINGADKWTEPVIYAFKVLPPWYRSWLAYLVYAVIMITGIWRIYLLHKEKILRAEREKAQQRELEHAREIETAYHNLEVAHENLKATQTQLIHSEKMASLGSLTAGIAHEIQNPLNFVNNFAEVSNEMMDEMKEELSEGSRQYAAGIVRSGKKRLKLAGEIADEIKQNLEKIKYHGKRAETIVKGMLLHSRGTSGHKEPTDINSLCDEYLRLSYHGFRAKDKSFNAVYKTGFDPNLPKVNVVPQDIGRVLLNLFNNAFYACDERSKLYKNLELLKSYRPQVVVSTKKLNDTIRISVKDNGTGIPEEIKGKIFQPFFTTKSAGKGTGLGLSIAYDIVKAHGGELKVETKVYNPSVLIHADGGDALRGHSSQQPDEWDEGTIFTIELPIHKNEL